MRQAEITHDVKRFITEHVRSAEQLDILLLLHADPEKRWTAGQVSGAVFTVPTSAAMRLETLAARGFLGSSGGADPQYWYAPASAEQRAGVDALAAAYRADRVAVINLVFAGPPDSVKTFADAFRLRG